jgi:hypothetical protein
MRENTGRFHQSGPYVARGAIKEGDSVAVETGGAAETAGLEMGDHSGGTLGAGKVKIIAYFTSITSDETRTEIEMVEKRRGTSETVQCSPTVTRQTRRMAG